MARDPIVRTDRTGAKQSPSHPNGGYDATDRREDLGSAQGGFSSVDPKSGPVSESDWENAGRFPDGDGWKQT